jgi:beta-glucosidase
MNLKAKIGQMIVVRASGCLYDRQRRYPQWEADNQTLQRWLPELNLGGVILLGGSAVEVKERSQQLQSWAQTPLLMAADIEEGVGQRFSGLTWFPPPMALGEIAQNNLNLARQYARQMGAITAQEAVLIGINWLLAPVVDVNNNPDNPVINIRAFSDRHDLVSQLTTAFIEGTQTYPILSTAKHFPGHGDTVTDSHLDLSAIAHDLSRLQEIELAPFRTAIAIGVDSVMTAHLIIPEWDRDNPATLSEAILTGQLRQKLGFNGLIVTDALIMGGITKYAAPEEVAVLAILAGVDILLMPTDPQIAIDAIEQAVKSGRITEDRIDRSFQRIMAAKRKLGNWETEKLEAVTNNSNNGFTLAKDILRASLRMGGNLPLQSVKNDSYRNLIVIDDVLNSSFLDLSTPAIAVPQQLGYQRQILDRNSLNAIVNDSRKTLLQLFIRGNPFRGSAGLTPEAMIQYHQLVNSDRLIALIIYGSPYVVNWFLANLKPEIPWIFTYGQMDLAQEIALEALFNKAYERSDNDTQNKKESNLATPTNNFGF